MFSLDQEGKIKGQQNVKNYISNFYKESYLGHGGVSVHPLDSSKFGDVPQVTMEENDFLTSPFTEKEVRDAIFAMENNKAPGKPKWFAG